MDFKEKLFDYLNEEEKFAMEQMEIHDNDEKATLEEKWAFHNFYNGRLSLIKNMKHDAEWWDLHI